MKLKYFASNMAALGVNLLFVSLLFTFLGCRLPGGSGNTNNQIGPQNTTAPSADVLHPGDMINIRFSDVPNPPLGVDTRIREDGSILLPYNVHVEAGGKSVTQLQEDIQNAYVPKFYKRLTVIVASEQRYYTVAGQVRMPGPKPYLGETTVLSAIASAGDFTDFANRRNVKVTRASNNRDFVVDCVEAQQDQSKDPQIYPGDRINVPRRWY